MNRVKDESVMVIEKGKMLVIYWFWM